MSQEEPKTIEMKDAEPVVAETSQPTAAAETLESTTSSEPIKEDPKVEDVKTQEVEKEAEESVKEDAAAKETKVTAPPAVVQDQVSKEPEPKFTPEVAIKPPALRRLNGDSSWLLSLPLIDEESKYSSFNLVSRESLEAGMPWFQLFFR